MFLTPRSRSSVAVAVALLGGALLAPGASTAVAAPAYSVQTLHFAVQVGPGGDQACDVVGDLYVPADASSTHRVPAVLTTNGFGGSKDDQAGGAAYLASNGYVALSYSGLGFGGSSCRITLDDPDYDGLAASQLISFLGGASGIAYTDAAHTVPAPVLDVVRLDATDHAGNAAAHDPRVGMIGGSYGGGVQFAAAAVDPRLDTIVPMITWNDLSYSLAPNGTSQTTGVSSAVPGAAKTNWALGFSGLGMTGDLQNGQVPGDPLPCPNFASWVCPALATAGLLGYLQPGDVEHLRHASVASYVSRVRIPTLLLQGQKDTLFNLNEAIATYRALRAQGTVVKMVWHSWGHSGATPAPGEFSLNEFDPATQYESGRVAAWFDRYLKDKAVSTGPNFAWFRDWVGYTGNAAPAYASAGQYPVGSSRTYRLSGAGQLTTGLASAGSKSFLTPPLGLPTSLNPIDVIGGYTGQLVDEVVDVPGTFAAWQTPVLTGKVDVVGVPVVTVKVNAPTAALTQGAGPAGQLVLFVKVADVGADGKARLIHGLEIPVRIADVTKPVRIELPAIVHRFAAGHRIRLIVAGGSVNYRGGLQLVPVSIASGNGQTLVLPVTP